MSDDEDLEVAVEAASFKPSNPVTWKRSELLREIAEGYVRIVPSGNQSDPT